MININKEYLQELDKKINLVPLTFDYAFKYVFNDNLDLLKRFILLELNLDLSMEDCTISLPNTELFKENKNEAKKTIDIRVTLNEKIHIDIEMNRSSFNSVKLRNFLYFNKLVSMMLKTGERKEELEEKKLYQLNLNTEDKNISFGEDMIVSYSLNTDSVYVDNCLIILKYLEYYRKIYYTNSVVLSEAEIWLVALTSKSFSELYEITGHILSDSKREKLLKDVIRMSEDNFILHEWEKEKMDALVMREEHKSGIEEGFEQGIKQIVQKMLKKNMSLEEIAEITDLSIDKINNLK